MDEQSSYEARQAAYERAYYEAAGEPSPSDGRAESQPGEQPSFAEYVSSPEFWQGQPSGQSPHSAPNDQPRPFVDNAYQQPWSSEERQYQSGASPFDNPYYPQDAGRGYPQQGYRPYVATKDHVAAGLLAIFLGSFGVHKFYLGYNTAGFIMLAVSIFGSMFTLGISGAVMSLIGFIEGIIYLTKRQDVFDSIYVYGTKEWF